jgi:hypothetical protein
MKGNQAFPPLPVWVAALLARPSVAKFDQPRKRKGQAISLIGSGQNRLATHGCIISGQALGNGLTLELRRRLQQTFQRLK